MKNNLTDTPAAFAADSHLMPDCQQWLRAQPSMRDAWETCPRASWLLSLLGEMRAWPEHETLRLFAVWAAQHTPLRDGRPCGVLLAPESLAALAAATKHANGQADADEMHRAMLAGSRAWRIIRATESPERADVALIAWSAAEDAWAGACVAFGVASRWDDLSGDGKSEAAQATQFRSMVANPFAS